MNCPRPRKVRDPTRDRWGTAVAAVGRFVITFRWLISACILVALLLCASISIAQSAPRAAVIVDASGDVSVDAQVAAEIGARLRQRGYEPLPSSAVTASLQRVGGYSTGDATADPAVLERVRVDAGAAVLVRVSRMSGGPDWVGAGVSVLTERGNATTSAVAKFDQARDKLADAAISLLPSSPQRAAAPASAPQPVPPARAAAAPPPDPKLQGAQNRSDADVSLREQRADASFQRDCARDPTQEICKQEGRAQIGPGGLRAGFSQETVTRVKEPPSSSFDFAIDGSFTYGKLEFEFPLPGATSTIESEFYGGGVSLGVKILTGGRFPGTGGGSWFGLFIDPAFSVSGAGGQMTIPGFTVSGIRVSESKQGYGMLLLNGGVALGAQWLTFGSMDPETLEQVGFGVNAGYRIGMQGSQVYFEGGSGDFTTAFSHGPVLGLSFPFYNAGTASLSRAYVQGMILPSGDMLIVTVAAGYAF